MTHIVILPSSLWPLTHSSFILVLNHYRTILPTWGLLDLMLRQGSPGRKPGTWHLLALPLRLEPIKSNCSVAALGSDRLTSLMSKQWSCRHTWIMVCFNSKSTVIHSSHFLGEGSFQDIRGDDSLSPKGRPPGFQRDDRWETRSTHLTIWGRDFFLKSNLTVLIRNMSKHER